MSSDSTSRQRIVGPAELVQAIPYLLGFHPRQSLVLVGLAGGALVVTARLDLADARTGGVVHETVAAMCRGGTEDIVGAVYDEPGAAEGADPRVAHYEFADIVEDSAATAGCSVLDVLLVLGERWWSLTCASGVCCPTDGRPALAEPSAFAAAATYAGVVALPDRAAVERLLDPLPEDTRAALRPALAHYEDDIVTAARAGVARRQERSCKRALFAAARAAVDPGWAGVSDADVARFGAALVHVSLRDAAWMAVDDGRLDGRPLWRELARRLPSPYNAPPLFLFGWVSWRSGDGALAGIAAQRAVASDPGYSAADLLLAALHRGLDPRRLPRLRRPA